MTFFPKIGSQIKFLCKIEVIRTPLNPNLRPLPSVGAPRGQGPTPGCMQRAAQCSQGLDLLFSKVDGAARRLDALINAKQAIGRRLDAAQVGHKALLSLTDRTLDGRCDSMGLRETQ